MRRDDNRTTEVGAYVVRKYTSARMTLSLHPITSIVRSTHIQCTGLPVNEASAKDRDNPAYTRESCPGGLSLTTLYLVNHMRMVTAVTEPVGRGRACIYRLHTREKETKNLMLCGEN